MPRSKEIELEDGTTIPILYEDRNVLAVDKPAGWMLAPTHWDRTGRNLQLALESSLIARDFWAASRNLKFLRFVHRLDADTSGILLLAKNGGVVKAFQQLFEGRLLSKNYLAVVRGVPREQEWVCRLPIGPDPAKKGKMRVGTVPRENFKEAETRFRVLEEKGGCALVGATPVSGRTHQIRVHLAAAGYVVVGDCLYAEGELAEVSKRAGAKPYPLGLRAVGIAYRDPFTGKAVEIAAPVEDFLRAFGFLSKGVARPKGKEILEGL